jgi:hypothetical protein
MKEMGGDSRLANPDIVAAFNNMQMELSLLAKKEIKLDSDKKFKNKYYACIVVDFVYRTAPQAVRSGQSTHYAHVGIIDVYFKAYAFTDKELEKVQRVEVYEDMELVDHLTDVSLKDLTKDLDHFLDDEEEVEEKKVFVLPNPLKGFKELVAPLKNVPEFFGDFKPKGTSYQESKLKAAAKAKAKGSCLTLYDVFKKAHRMITW